MQFLLHRPQDIPSDLRNGQVAITRTNLMKKKLTKSMVNVLEHLSGTDSANYGQLAAVGANGANLKVLTENKLLKLTEKKVADGTVKHWAITGVGKKALKSKDKSYTVLEAAVA